MSDSVTDSIVKKKTYVTAARPAGGEAGAAALIARRGGPRRGARRRQPARPGDARRRRDRALRRHGRLPAVAAGGLACPHPRALARRVRRGAPAMAHHRRDRALDHLRAVRLRSVPQLGAQYQRLGLLRGTSRTDCPVGGRVERARAHGAGRGVDRLTGLHRRVLGLARCSRCPPAAPSGGRRSGNPPVSRSAR